jgi:DNA-binding MarR family transcriptional regulator
VLNVVILNSFKMNDYHVKDFTQSPDLAVDGGGLFFDRRVRTMLESLVGPESARRLEVFAAMRWLSGRSHQFMERSVDRYGLSEGRMQVLMRLRHQGDCPLGALADAMHVSARNVTGLVDHLERDGLVSRVPDTDDRRSVRAHLTEEGQRLIEQVWKEVSQRSLVLVQDMPQEDLDIVRHTCLELIRRMESQLGQEGVAIAAQRSSQE